MEGAAARVEGTFGPIDIWVNKAMTSVFSPFREMTADEFRRVIDIADLGHVHRPLAAHRRMLPPHPATIVQVGSAHAGRGVPLQAACCGAMHAIAGFTDSIRANCSTQGATSS